MSYAGYAGVYNDTTTPVEGGPLGVAMPDDFKGAAVSVAFLLVGSALFLTLLKRSGFRAMVAVGRQ